MSAQFFPVRSAQGRPFSRQSAPRVWASGSPCPISPASPSKSKIRREVIERVRSIFCRRANVLGKNLATIWARRPLFGYRRPLHKDMQMTESAGLCSRPTRMRQAELCNDLFPQARRKPQPTSPCHATPCYSNLAKWGLSLPVQLTRRTQASSWPPV